MLFLYDHNISIPLIYWSVKSGFVNSQVKDLADFQTRSPFIGLQEWRQFLTADHETSFFEAFQENIGTTETFLSGIENNIEMKIAFMGDKTLDITPCKPPPHPRQVRLWAEKKLAKKRKSTTSEQKNDVLKGNNEDNVQDNHGPVKMLQKETSLVRNEEDSPFVLKTRDIEGMCMNEKESPATHGPTLGTDGSPTAVEVTSPSTLFSPVEDPHVFTFANVNQSKQDKSNVDLVKRKGEDATSGKGNIGILQLIVTWYKPPVTLDGKRK